MKFFFEAKEHIEIDVKHNLDFPPHLHDFFEIGYVEKGSATLIIEEIGYNLKEGDFFVVFPNQIHHYKNSNNILVKMIIFNPRLIKEYNEIFLSNIPENPVIEHNNYATEIINLIFKIETKNVDILKGLLLALFGILTDGMTFKNIEKFNISTLKNILLFCEEHFTEPITVSEVASSLHISRYHIAHIFREKLNTTFSEYITEKRIEYASALLCNENYSIIDIAYKSGFNSLRTFNRNFLKYLQIPPKEYRKIKISKK